jgi:translocator protein
MNMYSISLAGRNQVKWYHGVIFFITMHVLSAGWLQTPEYLATQVKAPFTPPGWVFGLMWTINTILMVWAGILLLNKDENAINRQTLITLQSISWICFVTFGWLYFGLHSTILAFINTLIIFGVTATSIILGYRLDKRFSYALIPLIIWLTAASALSIYQFLYNPDELFHTVAPIH